MSKKYCNKLALTTAIAAALTSVSATAGGLVGKVTDANGSQLYKGAKVSIAELDLVTTTDQSGVYRFANLPAGEYKVVVEYIGAGSSETTVTVNQTGTVEQNLMFADQAQLEDIVVYAQRAGQAGAINAQKNADSIKSIVSADAIGQFPDQNVSEALQRLPGMFIERDQGEGRFVGIRGIDPNLNNVTINGLNVPSPESGVRSVALDVIPSNLVGGLEVSKSVTPDMDADAIGGSIEVKSLSGFDRAQQSITFSAEMAQNQLRDSNSPKVSASYTDIFDDTFAVAAALSYSDREFGSDNIESNGDDEIEQRFYAITRERIGAAVNLDYRPDFNNQYFVRTLFSEFSDDEYRLSNTFVFDDEGEIERATKDRKETQQIISLTAGGEHQVDSLTVNYQLGYSKAEEENPNALYYTLKGEGLTFDSNMQGQIPQITQGANVADFTNYELDEVSDESEFAQDEESSFKLDLTKKLLAAGTAYEFKSGIKLRQREKTARAIIDIYDDGFDAFTPTDFATATPDWSLGDFGPGLNRQALRNFTKQNKAGFEKVELDSDLESQGASYTINEDIFATYAMVSADFGKLNVVAGVRYEQTDFSTQGAKVELVEDEQNDVEEVQNTPWSTEESYSKLLPSINLRYELSDKLIARAAYTQTLARPKFEDVGAYQIIESSTEENDDGEFETEREAEAGNPSLKPYFADNFDLSLEYYPGHIGVLSAGYFHKSIDNFVIVVDVAGTSEWQGYDEVFQPINGQSAKLHGVELAWVKSFDSGLLLAANATLTDSEATTIVDGEVFETQLPNQSDTIANFTLGFENDTVSLRLTSVYKSKNLEEIDDGMLRYEDAHTQLDFSGKYYINQQTHIYFNAVNINDEPMYHYFDNRNQNAQYETYGRTFQLGFSWASF
ncbi:TonB-dependent receptor [Catenovulum agarivorans DS-2]|uniref:TonB-dependent receptor n=1 Tax=Catenovulum agarivorans DS-2 TaxID=1328313 RepID=W7QBI9_9ALTE|nr:TonB-dependent receptor [Catenovulum agarivorans]EWH09341.1 TonB-dependent receptor [Catenovulum agarivorans DS-2]